MRERWLHLIYLCGPVGDDPGHTWRQQVSVGLLQEFGVASYSPAGAFHVGDARGYNDPVSHAVLAINTAAVAECDAIFAVLPPGKQALGSIREIQMAREDEKPVVVVSEARRGHFAVDLDVVPTIPAAIEVVRGWCESDLATVKGYYIKRA